MRRVEYPNNTREQVAEYIATAVAIVAELDLDGDLKVPAFEKAVDLCAGKQVMIEQAQIGGLDLRNIPRG